MDAELRELVAKFQSLQRSESNVKVNDRNVVEIIHVLQRTRKSIDVIFTTDGKEFLTWTHLRTEIINEIIAAGGRMNIVDLPGPLNVDMIHIERCIPAVMADMAGAVLLAGEIIFPAYVDSLVQDAAELLKERGFLLLADMARSHQLPSAFLLDLFSRAVEDRRIHAVLHDAALYTKHFVHAQRLLLRSALLAATKPLAFTSPAFAARCELYAPVISSVAEGLAKELPGRIDGNVYVPLKFEQTRDSGIRNVYLSNGYVLYSVLVDGGIGNPRRYMQALVNAPATAADRRIVSESSSSHKKGGSRSKKTAGSDTPAAPTAQEVALSGASTAEYPDSGYALQKCFLADRFLRTLFISDFEALQAGEVVTVDLGEKLPAAVDGESDWAIIRDRMESLFPVITSDCVMVQQGKVIVANTVLQRAMPLITTIAVDEASRSNDSAKKAVKTKFTLSAAGRQKVLAAIIAALQCRADQGAETAEELLDRWAEPIERCFLEAMAAAAQHVTVEAKRLRSDVEARCSALWTELCILGKGAAWATAQLDDGEAAAGVHKAVLQGSAMAIARLLVVDEVLEGTAAGAEKAAAPLLVDFNVAVTVGQIRAVIACFEKKRQTPFLSLLDAAQGKSVDTFGELLSSLNATGEFRISAFRSLNKKVERDSFAVLRDNVAKSAGTASLALPHVSQSFAWFVSAIVAERFRVIISPIPGKAVPAIVARILRECAIPGLLQGRDVVVRVLRQPDAALTEEETAVLEQVRAEALGRGPSP